VKEIQSDGSGLGYPPPEEIYSDIIHDIQSIFGDESFYLAAPYRFLSNYSSDKSQKISFVQKYQDIMNRHHHHRESLREKLRNHLLAISPDLQILHDPWLITELQTPKHFGYMIRIHHLPPEYGILLRLM
jgi:hypothetical protein